MYITGMTVSAHPDYFVLEQVGCCGSSMTSSSCLAGKIMTHLAFLCPMYVSPHISDVWNVLTGLNYSDFLTFFTPGSYILFLASEFLSLCNHWKAMNVVLQKTSFHIVVPPSTVHSSTMYACVCIHMHTHCVWMCKLTPRMTFICE